MNSEKIMEILFELEKGEINAPEAYDELNIESRLALMRDMVSALEEAYLFEIGAQEWDVECPPNPGRIQSILTRYEEMEGR